MLCEPDSVALLREAFATVKRRHPFRIDAVILLSDHLRYLWALPPKDADYSTRWMFIKTYFTRCCAASLKPRARPLSSTNANKRSGNTATGNITSAMTRILNAIAITSTTTRSNTVA
jgi:REP element-mobilizing transposase RayT